MLIGAAVFALAIISFTLTVLYWFSDGAQAAMQIIAGCTVIQIKHDRGRSGAKIWLSRVYYDAWGDPFAYSCPSSRVGAMPLRPDGTAYDCGAGCKWALVSGKPIAFPALRHAVGER